MSLAVHAKQLAGEHIPSMIPYGYRKSTTQEYRFEPDPETAPIVRRIYAQFLSGIGARPIMRQLNEEGIPSPGRLRYLRGQTKRACYSDCLWTQQVIKQILMNPTYMGDLVFGRMPTALYLGQPDYHYEPDESKWRILPDMHEALVSRGDFYQVREILEAGRRENEAKLEASRNYREKHPQIFKAESSGAGTAVPISVTADTARKRKVGTTAGTSSMAAAMLPSASRRKARADCLERDSDTVCPVRGFEEVAGRLKDSGIQTKRQTELQQEMLEVSEQLSGYQNKREQLYNDYVDGILSAGDYIELKTRFDTAYQEQSSRLNQLSVELVRLNRMLSNENKWLVNIRNIRKARKLTPEIAQAMIDHINVYKTGYAQHRLEIIFRFQEERDALETAYHELEGGEAR